MLALIAGAGALPTDLVARLPQRPVICALQGFGPDTLDVDLSFRLETLGTLIETLRSRGVTTVCMAGAVGRPVIDPGALDVATLPLVPHLQAALGKGDDGALRAVIAIFEQAGLRVWAAHEIAPDLLPPTGVLSRAQPCADDRADAARAAGIVDCLSGADIGQSCVVMGGQALAVEGVYGTDWMLQSLTARPDQGQGGVLFKAPKTDQDRRVDLPTIGPRTMQGAQAAGLRGVVIAAQGVLMLDQAATLAAADGAGLFVWVREPAS